MQGQAVARVASAEEVTPVALGEPRTTTLPSSSPAKWAASMASTASDDAGSTWLAITDAAHQFASITRLAGDPRIFGRVYAATGGHGNSNCGVMSIADGQVMLVFQAQVRANRRRCRDRRGA